MRSRVAAVPVLALTALMLAGCSAPAASGARLNSDGTVDVVECYGPTYRIVYDYDTGSDVPHDPHWKATVPPSDEQDEPAEGVDVVYYGEVPPGWDVEFPAQEPPENWHSVSTPAGYYDRSELVEGEWVWFTGDEQWAWIPEHPCDGWEIGPDGEPRRVP